MHKAITSRVIVLFTWLMLYFRPRQHGALFPAFILVFIRFLFELTSLSGHWGSRPTAPSLTSQLYHPETMEHFYETILFLVNAALILCTIGVHALLAHDPAAVASSVSFTTATALGAVSLAGNSTSSASASSALHEIMATVHFWLWLSSALLAGLLLFSLLWHFYDNRSNITRSQVQSVLFNYLAKQCLPHAFNARLNDRGSAPVIQLALALFCLLGCVDCILTYRVANSTHSSARLWRRQPDKLGTFEIRGRVRLRTS